MSYLKIESQSKQPRLKADDTATLTFCSLYELVKGDFDMLNTWAYEKPDVVLVAVKKEDYVDFILAEAKKLTADIN